MNFLTTVPLIFDKPIYVWLGIILLFLVALQIILGLMMVHGRPELLRYHKINAALIVLVIVFHALYGLGVWFFNFRIK